jgi:hypothetical protein
LCLLVLSGSINPAKCPKRYFLYGLAEQSPDLLMAPHTD